jgi:hypothetical protein
LRAELDTNGVNTATPNLTRTADNAQVGGPETLEQATQPVARSTTEDHLTSVTKGSFQK